MDLEFLIGDIIVPVLLFVLGFFTGKTVEKKMNFNAKAKVKGNHNMVIQNSKIDKRRHKN